MKKVLVFALLIVICICSFLFFGYIRIYHDNNMTPSTFYNIKINKFTKKMIVKETHKLSYADDNKVRKEKNSVILTKEEYNKIRRIKKNKDNIDYLVSALSAIVKDDSTMYKEDDNYYEIEDDLNQDGIVTYREFGNRFLNNILEKE